MTLPSAFDCARRVPPSLRDDVPAPELPDGSQGAVAVYADRTTGALDQANDEKRTVLWIIDACEAEKAEAVDSLQPPLWRRLTPWRD